MLLESLIRRKAGTTVTLGTAPNVRTYHFVAKAPDPRHLCDVANEDDVDTLVAIKEGYRIARSQKAAAAPAPDAAEAAADAAAAAKAQAEAVKLTVAQVPEKTGKWFVVGADGNAVSDGYAKKSQAEADLAARDQKAGQ